MIVILAHGSLGSWDEIIFLGIIVIFVALMLVSWFLSRSDNFNRSDLMPRKRSQEDEPSDELFTLE